jgi:hypothetical protein
MIKVTAEVDGQVAAISEETALLATDAVRIAMLALIGAQYHPASVYDAVEAWLEEYTHLQQRDTQEP